MYRTVSDVQRNIIFRMLDEVMAIMRDDKPFDPDDGTFGKIRNTRAQPGYPGMFYSFKNISIPPATIEFVTASNPLDYSEDRTSVPVVPIHFKLNFDPPIDNLTEDVLKKRLDLADYWIDRDGVRHEGNEMPPPGPGLLLKPYRYRAKTQADSRFPVDVEIVFGLPTGDEPKSQLFFLTIERAYALVTPEDRKRMREEKEQRVRELYGKSDAAK
ncbi:hypothetical protein [Paraburkholderia oxyphila]|uniref:hypothetical protein n=1 Tax=Paraburkholderia oxyphila TaxID=614212 RepID=UPI0006941BEF|nr:hypothetical protein [Paraburkholderia oxyphila]